VGGSVHVDTDGGSTVEIIDPSGAGPNFLRWLWEIRPIGRSVYAAGMLRMVYRRLGPGKWVSCNRGAEVTSPDEVDAGFRSIDGFAEDDLIAVGLHGEIWLGDGRGWSRVDSPTNVRLDRVRCVAPGLAYACGAAGVILRGEGHRWSAVDQSETEDTFWDMAYFAGRLYLATTRALFVLDGDELARVEMIPDREITTEFVDAGPQTLWSVGRNDMVTFDGSQWVILAPPLRDQ
jgi:hypothetical protein